MQSDTILDATSVAEQLRCSTDQADELMRRGDLPATKVGRGWITTYGQVLEFVIARIKAERKCPEPIKATVVPPTEGKRRRALPELPAIR